MMVWDWSWIDPAGIWYYGLHSTQAAVSWSHPEVDELLDLIIEARNEDERTGLWSQIVWEDTPLIPFVG